MKIHLTKYNKNGEIVGEKPFPKLATESLLFFKTANPYAVTRANKVKTLEPIFTAHPNYGVKIYAVNEESGKEEPWMILDPNSVHRMLEESKREAPNPPLFKTAKAEKASTRNVEGDPWEIEED